MHEVGVFIKNVVFTKWIEFSQRLKVNIEYRKKCFSHLNNGPLYKSKANIIFFLDFVVRRLLNLKSRLTFKSFVFRRMQRLEGFSILNIKIKEKGKCGDGNLIKKSKAGNKLTYGPCTLSPIMII